MKSPDKTAIWHHVIAWFCSLHPVLSAIFSRPEIMYTYIRLWHRGWAWFKLGVSKRMAVYMISGREQMEDKTRSRRITNLILIQTHADFTSDFFYSVAKALRFLARIPTFESFPSPHPRLLKKTQFTQEITHIDTSIWNVTCNVTEIFYFIHVLDLLNLILEWSWTRRVFSQNMSRLAKWERVFSL